MWLSNISARNFRLRRRSRLQNSYSFPQKANATAPTRNRNETAWFHLMLSPRYDHANMTNTQSDYFLDDFQLKCCKFTVAEPIRWDLKTVFGERNQPAHDDYSEKRSLAVLQVTVPCDCHEDVGTNKK